MTRAPTAASIWFICSDRTNKNKARGLVSSDSPFAGLFFLVVVIVIIIIIVVVVVIVYLYNRPVTPQYDLLCLQVLDDGAVGVGCLHPLCAQSRLDHVRIGIGVHWLEGRH